MLDHGREIARDPAVADAREWLCANGIGGFASGTVSGILTRRYHGLLVAALAPPLRRMLLVARTEDRLLDGGTAHDLSANRWADGTLTPRGFELIERFRLDGTVPVWTYACADLRIEKRVWMEHGVNTTYVGYRLTRATRPVTLELRALVNYRDFHAVTRGGDWWMAVAPVPGGIRVEAYDGAHPFFLLAEGADIQPVHDWYHGFRLAAEEKRGLEFVDDHLHAATFETTLAPGADFTLVLDNHDPDGKRRTSLLIHCCPPVCEEDPIVSMIRTLGRSTIFNAAWIRSARINIFRRPWPTCPACGSIPCPSSAISIVILPSICLKETMTRCAPLCRAALFSASL